MGIYYKIINPDRKEMVCPGELGEGLKGKLLFQTWTHRVLAWLLQDEKTSPYDSIYEGAWANTKVSIVADYGSKYEDAHEENGWRDIGQDALIELCTLYEWRDEFLKDTDNVSEWDKNLIALRERVRREATP